MKVDDEKTYKTQSLTDANYDTSEWKNIVLHVFNIPDLSFFGLDQDGNKIQN